MTRLEPQRKTIFGPEPWREPSYKAENDEAKLSHLDDLRARLSKIARELDRLFIRNPAFHDAPPRR